MSRKVGELDAVCGANLGTLAAGNALVIIDNREVIYNSNCICGAVDLALLTADAGVLTVLSCNSALVVRIAHNSNSGITGNDRNNILWTFLGAHTAADAYTGVNTGNAVFKADSVYGADTCTVAATDTAKAADVGAAVKH